jgi:Ca2+:H+ antiporter
VLTPLVLVADRWLGASGTVLFVIAAAALIPLAYLIGEATENLAEHTGAGVGGFLNSTFGNAPELIISLVAISDGLPNVVRGSLTGSVISTALALLGAVMVVGDGGAVDRRSLLLQISLIALAVSLLLVPSAPSWAGVTSDRTLYALTVPVAAVLLGIYVVGTARNLRTHYAARSRAPAENAWSPTVAVVVLALTTAATALVAEVLVASLVSFTEELGLSELFVSAVIVALVGDAAEHGAAITISRRGNTRLGAEIAVHSSTQIALLTIPVVALLSPLVGPALPLSFRPVEIVTMAGAALLAMLAAFNGRAERSDGVMLLAGYAVAVAAFWLAGDA